MFHLVLFQPEIPQNTGNIIRLCANVGSGLHLIHPLGFELDDRRLRRAGLDYHEWVSVREYPDLPSFQQQMQPTRLLACTTRGTQNYNEVEYRTGDVLLFGPETRGLPQTVLDALPPQQRIRIPLRPGNRSLNLSNAAAVILYEAWRQQGYSGADR